MGHAATEHYHARLRRVLAHIDRHLKDDLTVEALSEVAAFSKHHFHRQFTAAFGIGVYRYIQLLRLKRASYRLAFRDDAPVTDIALDAGYDSPEAFARAFKQRLGQTPTEFRKDPHWAFWKAACEPLTDARTMQMQHTLTPDRVRIIDVPDTPVAILRHRGDPARIGATIQTFIAWRKAARLPPKVSATFNILHDNPVTTPPADFRLDLCAATTREIEPNDAGVTAGLIPGGRCATIRHVGSDDGLAAVVTYLYADWLPQSGEEPRDFPLYCQRVSFFPDVPEHEAVIDVFLPLR